MSENKKNIIGEVSVEVKAGFSIDEKTFRTCMGLIAIHAENRGIKGMAVFFDMNDADGYSFIPLKTDEECSKVWDSAFGREE